MTESCIQFLYRVPATAIYHRMAFCDLSLNRPTVKRNMFCDNVACRTGGVFFFLAFTCELRQAQGERLKTQKYHCGSAGLFMKTKQNVVNVDGIYE